MFRTWCIYMLLLFAGLCSCKNSDMPAFNEDSGVEVTLLIKMPQSERARATYEAQAFGNDYYIYPIDVTVLVYNLDGTLKSYLFEPSVSAMSNSYHLYTLNGKLENFVSADLHKEYKIVVFTNMSGYSNVPMPSQTQLETLSEAELYAVLGTDYVDATEMTNRVIRKDVSGRIPMWGSKTTMIDGNIVATIDVMRAFAKVEIQLSDEMKAQGFEFPTNVSRIVGAYSNAWITPPNAHLAAETTETFVAGTEYTDINIYESDLATYMFVLHQDKLYAYIAEQKANTGFNSAGVRMEVNVRNGTASRTFPMYFANYVEGTAIESIPVRRNHHYIFTITDVLSLNYNLEYKVADWYEQTFDVPAFE